MHVKAKNTKNKKLKYGKSELWQYVFKFNTVQNKGKNTVFTSRIHTVSYSVSMMMYVLLKSST